MRILLTGAAGGIGTTLRAGLRPRHELRLVDLAPIADVVPPEEALRLDLAEVGADGLEAAMAGIEAVVHLAAIPHEDSFEAILRHNVIATQAVLEAARRAGVRRFVFASTVHAVGLYEAGERLGADSAPRPDTYYGASKAFGEDLCRLYHVKAGLEVACVRIGTFEPAPPDRRALSTWLSPGDAVRLFAALLEAPELGFEIVYGQSDNTRRWWDDTDARRLGYAPEDDAEAHADRLPATADPPPRCQGGAFVDLELGSPHQLRRS